MGNGQISTIIRGALCVLAIALVGGCEEPARSEKWIGTYSFPNNPTKFPLYLDIVVKGQQVSGRAFDGSMEEAAVSGSVIGEQYALRLHPLKQGTSTGQDIHYRGKRAKETVVGEWEHVVGMKGDWTVKTTELAAKEALKLQAGPCKPIDTARQANSVACGKDA